MKHLFAICVLFLAATAVAQNGPTPPSASLTWTQSTTTGIVKNCVYRGTATGVYTIPALFCSTAPATSFTDLTVVRGSAYHYAVTASTSTTESQYSNDVTATIPAAVVPPVLNTPILTRAVSPGPGVVVDDLKVTVAAGTLAQEEQ